MKGHSYTIPEEATAGEWGRKGREAQELILKKQEKKNFFFKAKIVRQFWKKYTGKLNGAHNLEISTWAASGLSWGNNTGEIYFEGKMLG